MAHTLTDILAQSPDIDRVEREILAAHILQKPREYVVAHPEHILTYGQEEMLRKFLERRAAHEPIAYIVGHKEFFSLDFLVSPDTLIPRPETELLVEYAIETITNKYRPGNSWLIADIGTGSGNIILSLVHAFEADLPSGASSEDLSWYGLDISAEALAIARRNAARHHIGNRVHFLQSDLLTALPFDDSSSKRYDHILLLANLPYLSQDIYDSATEDVRRYEPKTALISEESGLRHYRELLGQIYARYRDIPVDLFLEISPEQESAARQLAQSYIPGAAVRTFKDLTDRYRAVHVEHAP